MTVVINGTTGISGADGTAATPAIQGNDPNTGMFFPSVDTIAVATNGTERIRVHSSGGISVGNTTDPGSTNLSVTGSTRSSTYLDVSGGNTATINGSLPALNKAASALTDGATITIDMVNGPNFSVTLAGNRVLANPTNQVVGSSGFIVVSQDATGSRTLSYGTAWKWIGGQTPLLTTTASTRDVILYTVLANNDILASIARTV